MSKASRHTLLDAHFPRITGPEPMVDFVAAFFTVRGPEGAQIDLATIPGLAGLRVISDKPNVGLVSERKKFMVGRASTKVQIVGAELLISGNPAMVYGLNLFTKVPPDEAERLWLAGLLVAMGLEGYGLCLVRRTRLDLTNQIDCESEEGARALAECLRHTWGAPRKLRDVVGTTVYLSKKTHRWAIKAYSSAGKPRNGSSKLNSWHPAIGHFLRIEVCLRGPELRNRGIDRLQLTEIDLFEEFRSKITQCRTAPGNLRTPVEPPEALRKDRRRAYRDFYTTWASGTIGMKEHLPRWTYARLRERLLPEGFDVALPPNLAPEITGRVLRWDEVCHPSRWFATRFELSDVVMNRLRRRLNASMKRKDRN